MFVQAANNGGDDGYDSRSQILSSQMLRSKWRRAELDITKRETEQLELLFGF